MTWTWLRRGNLKKETESLLIVAKNKAIRTNYAKAKIDNRQKNSKCWLYGDRNKMVNHFISKYCKTSIKRIQEEAQLSGKGDLLLIVQEITLMNDNCTNQNLCFKMRFTKLSETLRYNPIT